MLEVGWDARYGRKVETGRLLSRRNASAQVLADQIGADGHKLMTAIDGDSVASWMNTLPEAQVLTESCDEDLPHLVTDVHTTAATEPDVIATTTIQDRLVARGLAPGVHLLDGGYPSARNITASAARNITLVAPVTVVTGRNAGKGTFTPRTSRSTGTPGWRGVPAGRQAGR